MTLIAGLVLGFGFGHFASSRTRAFQLFIPTWLAVLVVQTILMVTLPGKDNNVDVAYVILQLVFLAIGVGALLLGVKTHKPRHAAV